MLKTIEMIEIEGKSYKVIEFDEIDQEKYHGFIFVTVNKLDGKKYVGKKSWTKKSGRRHPENYLGSGIHFTNAVNKYGSENFIRYIIDLAESKDGLTEKEEFYINEEFNAVVRNDWYNISRGGDGGDTHTGRTEEEKKKTSKKMSESLKGNSNSSKPVVIFKNGEYLNEFSSITSAANTLEQAIGGNLGYGLQKLARGWVPSKRSQLYGYSVVYLEDYEKWQEDQLQIS